jgi:hypothetical protein
MPHVLFAVGDMAGAADGNPGSVATAALTRSLLATHPGSVLLVLGDNAYNDGTAAEYAAHYVPVWGDAGIKPMTFACPGNHDYHTPGAAPYYAVFGDRSGEAGRGFYSFDWNGWHIVSLNTEADYRRGSGQLRWLEADLRRHDTTPTIAFFHRPRFGSGGHGDSDNPEAFWEVMFAHRVEIALCGHAHHYERFAPQDPNRHPSPRGIRQFIVGTGGRSLVPPSPPGRRKPNSEVADGTTWGVLKLTLEAASYQWEFMPAAGGGFTDRSAGPHAVNRLIRARQETAMTFKPSREQQHACQQAASLLANQAEGLRQMGSVNTAAALSKYVATLNLIAASAEVTLTADQKTDVEQATFVLEGSRDGLLTAEFKDRAAKIDRVISLLNDIVAAGNAAAPR